MLAFALALGGLLLAAPPLYPACADQSVRLFGISPALDQYLAGLVMIGEQVGSLALCFAFLLPALRLEAPSRTLCNTVPPAVAPATGAAYGALFGCQMISHRWPSGSRK